MTWIGPRVTMSMGEDHWLLRFLGKKNRNGIPAKAILAQLLIVNLLLLTGSFELVVIYIQFSLLLCSLLTVLGVIVLRVTRPGLDRPYRVWAYPLPPLVFAAITLWMMIYLLRSHPIESLSGLGTMLAGFVLYFCADRSRPALVMKIFAHLIISLFAVALFSGPLDAAWWFGKKRTAPEAVPAEPASRPASGNSDAARSAAGKRYRAFFGRDAAAQRFASRSSYQISRLAGSRRLFGTEYCPIESGEVPTTSVLAEYLSA